MTTYNIEQLPVNIQKIKPITPQTSAELWIATDPYTGVVLGSYDHEPTVDEITYLNAIVWTS